MTRFSTMISRSREKEESVERYQFQTDSGPAVTAVFSTASRSRGEESAQRRYELQTDDAAAFVSRGDEDDGAELSPLAGTSERKEPR